MRKPKLAILAVAAVSAATLTLTGCSTSASPHVALMDEADAQLPEWAQHLEDLPTINLTYLGETGEITAYAGRNDDDEWCVIATLPPTPDGDGDDWLVSNSCVPEAQFAGYGAFVTVNGGGRGGGAHLYPDGYTGTIEEGWVRINDNLAVRE